MSVDLPENLVDVSVSSRSWNGVGVDVAIFRCSGPVLHQLRHPNESRLSVLLEQVGGHCEPRLHRDRACPADQPPGPMHFAPAGMPVWGFSAGARYVRDANLIFDPASLSQTLAVALDTRRLTAPRLPFADERVWTLVKLLAEAVDDPDPSSQMYGDGLVAAIAGLLFSSSTGGRPAEPGRLSARLLGQVLDYLHAHLPERVELARLAQLTGLSQAYFSRAFKASTGVSPYRWQLEERVRRAQALLLESSASLEEVAEATGFADAVHFGRTFRKQVGATPAAWRQDRKP
jgi:AraC family transcriptional regulator